MSVRYRQTTAMTGGVGAPRRSPGEWLVAAVLLHCFCALSVAGVALGGAQEGEEEPKASDAVTSLEKRQLDPGMFMGAASCASSNCHGSRNALSETRVWQNEYLIWLDGDPHATGFTVLYDDESALIARNMRLEQEAWRSKLCLDCHTLNVPEAQQANGLDLEEGVSCEVCHGPASGWIAGHTEEGWSHQESVSKGMVDMRNLATRVSTCLGCHLGNGEKAVDHELIAAGHPNLRFELDNYTGALPPHWAPYGDRQRSEGRADTHGIRAWAIGQIASFQESLQLLSRRAKEGPWPEFAEMSCDACHHDLEDSKWRQVRGYRDRPGLPPWSPARWAVLRLLTERVAPERLPGIEQQISQLSRSVARMNRPTESASHADELTATLAEVMPSVESFDWSAAEAKDLLRKLARDGRYLSTTDLPSAEQVLLAVNSLASYLAQLDRSVLEGGLPGILDKLDREVAKRSDFSWQRFSGYLQEIEAEVGR